MAEQDLQGYLEELQRQRREGDRMRMEVDKYKGFVRTLEEEIA